MDSFLASKAATIACIYVGTVFYTLAAYLHLKLGNSWTIFKALGLAIPLVLIEYQFSLRGNHAANQIHNLNVLQILIITLSFYFINLWILNVLVLHNPVVWWRELVCFLLIIAAFWLSTSFSL